MSEDRNDNGVRCRMDGKGDPWANEHRKYIDEDFYFTDIDGLIGNIAFAKRTDDSLFVEYVPDHASHRKNLIRQFAVVALFDRKASEAVAASPRCRVGTAFYLHICRSLRLGQPESSPPRFFFVIGKESPWLLRELDIDTGEAIGDKVLHAGQWREVWNHVGLTALRAELGRWLQT